MTKDKLMAIAKSLMLNKAPGPDGFSTVAIKSVIEACPDMFRMAMRMCLDRSEFPERWKRQRLVLDTPGKLLERIFLSRLMVYTEKPDDSGLSDNQFGFRKGRSTRDAIKAVTAKRPR